MKGLKKNLRQTDRETDIATTRPLGQVGENLDFGTSSKNVFRYPLKKGPFCPFLSILVSVLLSPSVERFSVSRMRVFCIPFLEAAKIIRLQNFLEEFDLLSKVAQFG